MTQTTSAGDTDKASVLALVQQAEQAAHRSEYGRALELSKLAESCARKHDDQHLLAYALLVCAGAEWDVGQTPSSYAHAIQAYSMFGSCGDTTRQLRALNLCAGALYVGGDRARSIKLFQQGVSFALGPDQVAIRAMMLRNLAEIFGEEAEYAEALACVTEAVALLREVPELRGQWVYFATEEAYIRVQYANDLKSRGLIQASLVQRQAAVEALPPLDYAAWRTFSRHEVHSLFGRVRVLAELKRFSEARHVAAISLVVGRRAGRRSFRLNTSLLAISVLCRACGAIRLAIRAERRALKNLEHMPRHPEIIAILHRLAQDYAQLGDYANAMAYRREIAGLATKQQRQAAALRSRLAAIERQAERQRYRANEALVHTQRLAVIGRLIAQTHHALSAPTERVLTLARKAQALSGRDAALVEVKPVLDQISRTINQAAALVNQLKLFSYRSTPQPMALSLSEALRSAWQGLAPHLGAGVRLAQLEVQDDAPHLQAWGDAQRLGIMLKLLLIELTQQATPDGNPLMIQAHIEDANANANANAMVLRLRFAGQQRMALLGSEPAQAQATLGVVLCQEIASEMGGALDMHGANAGTPQRYQLRLPRAKLQALPGCFR
jgi:tetratricopeptide (TPR) repeat protein